MGCKQSISIICGRQRTKSVDGTMQQNSKDISIKTHSAIEKQIVKNCSVVGIGNIAMEGGSGVYHVITPLRRPQFSENRSLEPGGRLAAKRDSFDGFVDVKLRYSKYSIRGSASTINLSDDGCQPQNFRKSRHARNIGNEYGTAGQEWHSACRRRLLTVANEKTEEDRKLELWMERQKKKDAER